MLGFFTGLLDASLGRLALRVSQAHRSISWGHRSGSRRDLGPGGLIARGRRPSRPGLCRSQSQGKVLALVGRPASRWQAPHLPRLTARGRRQERQTDRRAPHYLSGPARALAVLARGWPCGSSLGGDRPCAWRGQSQVIICRGVTGKIAPIIQFPHMLPPLRRCMRHRARCASAILARPAAVRGPVERPP